jgi:hypothetical protein
MVLSRKKELKELVDQQEIDRKTFRVRHYVTQTLPFKPYSEIQNEEYRSILILFKCQVNVREIGRLFHHSHETIYSILQRIFDDFPQFK